MERTDDCSERSGGSDPRRSEDEAVDRISRLPDSLLLHILSFLPFRYAVRTSLILRPFSGLWRSLRSLSFEECDFHSCYRRRPEPGFRGRQGFLDFVDNVLALQESCEIDRLRIEFDFHASGSINPESEGYNSEVANRLDKCILFALMKKVKALDIHLAGCDSVEVAQRVIFLDVNLSDEVMCNLVLGSPSLKKVSLRNCHGLRVLKIESHPSLEELYVSTSRGLKEIDVARSGIKILAIVINDSLRKIACPNVVTLELDGSTKGVNITCGSSVIDMGLHIRWGGFNGVFQEYPEVKMLLAKLQDAAYFTLCNGSILVGFHPFK
ncbi:putative F-box/LRR-repeat protein At3g18150 [Eucalyptus grandis]|uniref:putative F-box/LRR-repeat protein At3g18150 n=1 Tax=Eucalyptus grandis TaxID=71139 RepID=UPI00192F0BC5|nr:putative F-box/LRR-repeat protein At3g18150 [Eucalyptus grandis]